MKIKLFGYQIEITKGKKLLNSRLSEIMKQKWAEAKKEGRKNLAK